MSPADTDIPPDIHEKYEVHETRHAAAILVHDFYEAWSDVLDDLRGFVLKKSDILAPEGAKDQHFAVLRQLFGSARLARTAVQD